ncbi:MAG: glutaredoxin [Euryarchaeota archaeon]|nr:glutaredoxin [Euryarchaeota archaeon]
MFMSERAMALLKRADSDFFIVSTNVCPYCFKAKRYLDGHKLSWTEVNVQKDRQLRMEFVAMTGHRTVPVVFDIRGDQPIFVGGSDHLEEYL